MIILYLKAATEQLLIDALLFARSVDSEGLGIWITSTHEYALDLIGDLYNDDTVYSDTIGIYGSYDIITPATKQAGYHANLKCNERIKALVPVNIIIVPPPSRIQRVWAS
jgi:hypothetical protein